MDRCLTINNGREDAVAVVRDLTGALGADVAIEAVGVPATVELAPALARPGGRIANIGVHGQPATLHLEDLWIRNVGSSSSAVGRHTTDRRTISPATDRVGGRRSEGRSDPGAEHGHLLRLTVRTSRTRLRAVRP